MMGRGRRRCAAVCLLGFFNLAAAAECSGTSTVRAASIPAKTAACISWDGTLVISGTAPPLADSTGGFLAPTIALSSLSTVNGELVFTNIQAPSGRSPTPQTTSPPGKRAPQVTQEQPPTGDQPSLVIDVSQLSNVTKKLTFTDTQSLNIKPDLSQLSYANAIEFSNVNFGDDWSFAGNIASLQHVYELTITGTNAVAIEGTSLSNYEPINPYDGDARIEIANNQELTKIELRGFTNFIKTHIEIGNNGYPSVNFPNLDNAFVIIGNVSSFSAPSLITMKSEPGNKSQFISNNTFKSLDLSSVTTISHNLTISGNDDLTTIDFSSLKQMGDLQILNNAQLSEYVLKVNKHSQYFRELVECMELTSRSVTIPSTAKGHFSGTNTENFDCSSIKVPPGRKDCFSSSGSSAGASASSSSEASSGSSHGGLSTGAKAGIGVGAGFGALLVIGAVIFFCCRRRRDKSYSTREISSEPYSKSQHSYTESGEMAYSKVPYHPAGEPGGVSEPHSEEHTPTSALAHDWTPPERDIPSTQDRVELEEQQGMRHEMDARSLPDMDSEDDEEADTRSLEDIERIHRER